MPPLSSAMIDLGFVAPNFRLPDYGALGGGTELALDDVEGAKGTVVMFICNHCPFGKHVSEQLARLAEDYDAKGIGFVAISANDASAYPDDAPEKMVEEAKRSAYAFPYLFDETQEVAKAYNATCTPDFFVFDSNRKLVYRGQLDDSRPGTNEPVTGADLRAALDAILGGEKPSAEQKPSVGCSIKWKPGNEPSPIGAGGSGDAARQPGAQGT